jgi:hypothetical protein
MQVFDFASKWSSEGNFCQSLFVKCLCRMDFLQRIAVSDEKDLRSVAGLQTRVARVEPCGRWLAKACSNGVAKISATDGHEIVSLPIGTHPHVIASVTTANGAQTPEPLPQSRVKKATARYSMLRRS